MLVCSRKFKGTPAHLGCILLLKALDTEKDAQPDCGPVPVGITSCTGQVLLGREADELVKCFSPASRLSKLLAQPETKPLSSFLAVDKVFQSAHEI